MNVCVIGAAFPGADDVSLVTAPDTSSSVRTGVYVWETNGVV